MDTMYYKYDYIPFNQPLLSTNGEFGGSSSFAVYAENDGAGWRGGGTEAWRAFATREGYSGYYIGIGVNNESSHNLYIHMSNPNPINVTSYDFCFPGLESESDWGGFGNDWLYGSDDNSNWTLLGSGSNASRGGSSKNTRQCTGNDKYYKFYMLQCKTPGGGHRDGLDICSINLHGLEKVALPATKDDYDFKIEPSFT